MAKDKYISGRGSISGFSFANLGIFTGFADGVYNAVYSLVILEIKVPRLSVSMSRFIRCFAFW